MAAITWSDVTDIAAELSTVPVVTQTALLAIANDFLDVTNWGGETSEKLHAGRVYLAAHLATLGRRKGKAGMVASEAAGGLSRSYQNPMAITSSLELTSYGAIYSMLARSTAARAGFSLARGALVPSDSGWDG